jgi:Leucine-rich repeat (LRR) protein
MADQGTLQPLFLLSDEPIDGHTDDFLTREDDARTIAGAVLGTAGPFSVGIYGEWGTGKTSLLHHIRSLLEATESEESTRKRYPYLVTVFFNAWQHEKDAAPLAHLAEAVDTAITRRLQEVGSVTDKAAMRAVGWLRSAHLAARAIAYGTSVESRFDPTDELVKARHWQFWKWVPIFKFSGKDAIDRYEKLQKEATKPDSTVWKEHVDQSVTRSVLRSFRADKTLLDKVRPGAEKRIPRVVVFIDDMDRCLPEDAFELLQAIKLALAQPGFVFVMTLDPAALQPFLDGKVGAAGHNAGANAKAIYLDKLVQLPYPLRLHDDQFAGFVKKIVNVRLKEMLVAPKDFEAAESDVSIAPQWQVFKQLSRVLELSSQKNPRTLIRRINGLLTDARIASTDIKAVLDSDPAIAEGIFVGLCLIRHTLRQFVGIPETARISAAQPLCTLIKARGLNRCLQRLQAVTSGQLGDARTTPLAPGEVARNELGDTELMEARELLRLLKAWPRLDELFKTAPGQRWLGSQEERELVETFYAKRPEEAKTKEAIKPPKSVAGDAGRGGAMGSSPTNSADDPKPRQPFALDEKELAILERAIRGSLDLPADATLGPSEFARVTILNFQSDTFTDAGAAWLARPDSGLTALTRLHLSNTQVGDAGVAALAAKDSGLKALTTLNLDATQVGDVGAKALASSDLGLPALTTLYLSTTKVTDAGVTALAFKDSGLKALTTLSLESTGVGDAGAAALAAKDTGLAALTTLNLRGTQVGNAGAASLASKHSGLTALTTLYLLNTQVGDAGVAALAAKDTGLRALTTLNLSYSQVSDAGAKALAAKDSGLTALTDLWLYLTQVGDAGAASLATKDSGLTALTMLALSGPNFTNKGVAALAAKDSGLTGLDELHLYDAHIDDEAAAALAATDSGLTALSTLYLNNTQVTKAGVDAIRKAHPKLHVFH